MSTQTADTLAFVAFVAACLYAAFGKAWTLCLIACGLAVLLIPAVFT